MNELALFAGAGGGILGGTLLGFRTICAVEIEPYAASVLVARQNDGILPPFPIWDDICAFDGRPWRGIVDVVSGGFPCQDISPAGKGAGIDGERSGLWREMARVVREVGPRFVLVENSSMLVSRGLGTVLGDLAEMGYDAEWCVLGADDAGAPHIRKRIWILAHSQQAGLEGLGSVAGYEEIAQPRDGGALAHAPQHGRIARGPGDTEEIEERREPDRGGVNADVAHTARVLEGRAEQRPERERAGQGDKSIDVADAPSEGPLPRAPAGIHCEETGPGARGEQSQRCCDSDISHTDSEQTGRIAESRCQRGWWESEPDVGRVAHGVAARVDRLKAIGNGQVPAVVRLACTILTRSNAPAHPVPPLRSAVQNGEAAKTAANRRNPQRVRNG